MRAVKLRRQGHSRTAIGEMLEAHRNTIGRWVADHKVGGVKALQIKKRGRKEGEKRRLRAPQEKAVQAMICFEDARSTQAGLRLMDAPRRVRTRRARV